jgi:hypothetical protein
MKLISIEGIVYGETKIYGKRILPSLLGTWYVSQKIKGYWVSLTSQFIMNVY